VPSDPAVAVRVRITGRVQGVWFRAWAVNVARDLCLDGWVRNRTDRSVEAVFCGPAAQVERMIANCAEGPPVASVDDVQREPVSEGELDDLQGHGFHQRPTA
jgi:acylphosphatase